MMRRPTPLSPLLLALAVALLSATVLQAFMAPSPRLAATRRRPSSSSPLRMTAESSSSSRGEYLRGVLATAGAGLTAGAAATTVAPTPARAVRADEVDEDQPTTVLQYIEQIDKLNLKCPDFPKTLEWVNVGPLSLQKELRGKVVLLDFWTYCCINCMHVLPTLAKLEEKYKDQPFAVVGVHSAKFRNEQDTANIREAIARYRIQHPVVNDKDMQMFSAVGVSSWPSLVLVSPKGTLISIWPGEGNGERIDKFIETSLKYYGDQGLLDRSPLALSKPQRARGGLANSRLSYPGKVHVDPSGSPRLFVSDSGNHRVLVVDKNDGSVLASIGSGAAEPGFEDGDFAAARFSNPQGLCASRDGRTLYVCDTDNHAVRAVDLEKRTVATLAGNGEQGFDYSGGKAGKAQYLSSPWDVVLDPQGGALLVAMAGTHQIWRVELPSGKAACYSGTGREAETNAANRLEAAWAQPSGLALAGDGGALYVADSESSTVRELQLGGGGSGRTRTLVGGENGRSLFAFGDKDGKGSGAKLQHPLGVAAATLADGTAAVLVADSYNHKIKVVDPAAGAVTTLVGAGKPGLKDGKAGQAALWEPGGLAPDPEDPARVWVADTNNHAVRVLDVASGQLSTFSVKEAAKKGGGGPEGDGSGSRSILNRRRARVVDLGVVGRSATIQLEVALPPGLQFTATRPSEWQLVGAALGAAGGKKGPLDRKGEKGTATVKLEAAADGVAELESAVYFCEEDQGVCRSDGVIFRMEVKAGGPADGVVVARHAVALPAKKPGVGAA